MKGNKMKQNLKNRRYIVIMLIALAIGLIIGLITNAAVSDVKTDELIKETDAFIEAHEGRPAASYRQIETEMKNAEIDDEMQKIVKKSHISTISDEKRTLEASYKQINDKLDEGDTLVLNEDFFRLINGNTMTPEEFREAGVIFWDMWKYTWYSENVLPGEGLQIPGRWSDGDFVRDQDGYLCVASNEIPQGDIVDTPFGQAKVYDWIGDGVTGVIDIYVSW